eukprot:TRINITY_DN55_c0_g1_i1.p1 TRINITY_DN55_c0_g1~~TRINITY_DN55_c0_g1_i1.p1  ORF type:complete len:258 (+),score=69.32 TRINITY_DN55_c0_g1_i1:86-859(+)
MKLFNSIVVLLVVVFLCRAEIEEPGLTVETPSVTFMPTIENGYATDEYVWKQTRRSIILSFSRPLDGSWSNVRVGLKPDSVRFYDHKTGETLLWRMLSGRINVDETDWEIEGDSIVVFMAKEDSSTRWTRVFDGEPELDQETLDLEPISMDDLPEESQQTVKDLLAETRAKAMGEPTKKDLESARFLKQLVDSGNPEFKDMRKQIDPRTWELLEAEEAEKNRNPKRSKRGKKNKQEEKEDKRSNKIKRKKRSKKEHE